MCQPIWELEALFEDHGPFSAVITDSLALERVLALAQPLPAALQLANRQKEVHFLSDLVVALAIPPRISGFTFPVLDLAHVWFGSDSDVIEPDDIPALAAVFMFIKLHFSPKRRYPRALPEQPTASEAQLTRQQPGDVPVLHNAFTIQQVATHRMQDAGTAGKLTGNPHAHGLG